MSNEDNNLFQVSVKGMFFNDKNKLMLIQENSGQWELPGGRIQKTEQFLECLTREVKEETGLECEVLEKTPSIIYPTVDGKGLPRIMVFFKVKFKSLEFKSSSECVAVKFFTKEEIVSLPIVPQLKPLLEYL